jgi:phosphohistidine swiveling domain-containing protein
MADRPVAKVLETQVSLTEWIQRINKDEADALAKEDNHKRERIGKLNTIIGLPYDKPTTFEAQAIADRTPAFEEFLAEHGHELCALRLIPKPHTKDLPKLRMRGKTIRDALVWFGEQTIDYANYTADFVPHPPDDAWATIFIVNDHGIYGEIYFGGHHILTQGYHVGVAPHVFSYDFTDWHIDPANEEALVYLKKLVEMIHVTDAAKREQLEGEVKAQFAHSYIKGYFETTDSKAAGIWFIDYNRILGERYSDFVVGQQTVSRSGVLVAGHTASAGKAQGRVRIVQDVSQAKDFPAGGILVCTMTSPDYLPLMQKAGAIVTDQGGILCHAAIVARELNIPCLVGAQNATSVLKEGQEVTVDADKGVVNLVSVSK